ncbi:hypothetical protein N7462_003466 [Penicillium macrosclerotiorum]|uniref:uncharacterized protein n=1 Tax=Penicillium macrosclerotiorum TaxID=303699 RepID=UPI0025482409|nr:uncharacterized protein N7462_003466 [Penicillium macrosclerotiorum]KAJ5689074.1 hypothetical protein N7462_003466 [Penicillium macrosclerotiorum]
MPSNATEKPRFLYIRSSESFIVLTVSVALFVIIPIIPKAIVDRAGVRPEDGKFDFVNLHRP